MEFVFAVLWVLLLLKFAGWTLVLSGLNISLWIAGIAEKDSGAGVMGGMLTALTAVGGGMALLLLMWLHDMSQPRLNFPEANQIALIVWAAAVSLGVFFALWTAVSWLRQRRAV